MKKRKLILQWIFLLLGRMTFVCMLWVKYMCMFWQKQSNGCTNKIAKFYPEACVFQKWKKYLCFPLPPYFLYFYLLVGRDKTHYSLFHLCVILTNKASSKLHPGVIMTAQLHLPWSQLSNEPSMKKIGPILWEIWHFWWKSLEFFHIDWHSV